MVYERSKIIDVEYRVTDAGSLQPTQPEPKQARNRGRRGGALGTVLAALLFVVSKVKFLSTGLTALLSVGAYSLIFSWQFAIGLVVLIFIHEMGHVIALRRYGVKASAPIFIPFMGAFIGMKQLPKNATMEAVVGLGGPVIGSLGALGAWVLYAIYDDPLFLIMTYIGIVLNLFNLLPILPLDGGRAVSAISRWFWVVGFAGVIGLMIVMPNPILLIILLLGAPEAWHAIRHRGKDEDGYYTVPFGERVAISATYFGLIFVLGMALYELSPTILENRLG